MHFIYPDGGNVQRVRTLKDTANCSGWATSLWIRIAAYQTIDDEQYIVTKRDTDKIMFVERFYDYPGAGAGTAYDYLCFWLQNGAAAVSEIYVRTETYVPLNTWTHLFFWYDGTKIGGGNDAAMKLYINGVNVGSVTGGAVTAEYNGCYPDAWFYGIAGAAEHTFEGDMGQLRMFSDSVAGFSDVGNDPAGVAALLYGGGKGYPGNLQGVVGGLHGEFLFNDAPYNAAPGTVIGASEILDTSAAGNATLSINDLLYGGVVELGA